MRDMLRRLVESWTRGPRWAEQTPSGVLAFAGALSALGMLLALAILMPLRPLVIDGLTSGILSWEALVVMAYVTMITFYLRTLRRLTSSSVQLLTRRWLK